LPKLEMKRQELKDYLFAEANSCIGGILKELSKRGLIINNQDAFNAAKHCISDGIHGMRRSIIKEVNNPRINAEACKSLD